MRIGFFSQTIVNYLSGGRYYPYLFALALAHKGHDVTFHTDGKFILIDELLQHIPIKGSFKIEITDPIKLPPRGNLYDITIGSPLIGADYATTYSQLYNIPSIIIMYESPNWISQHRPVVEPKEHWENFAKAINKTNKVLHISEVGISFAQRWNGIKNKANMNKFLVVHPPVNTIIADKIETQERKPNVVYVGRCDIHKNADYAIRVWQHSNIKPLEVIILTGYLPNEVGEEYRRLAKEMGISLRIEMCCSEEKKFKILKEASLMIFPSVFEGFGQPPAEAIWCECPVVAYAIPTMLENYSGIPMASVGDFGTLRKLCADILKNNDKAIKTVREVKENIRSWADYKNFANKVSDIVEAVLNKETRDSLVSISTVDNLQKSKPTSKEDKNNDLKFSVIMPVYNPQQGYFKEALSSLVLQTYNNWELCVCDDGSSIDTLTFIEKSIPKDKLRFIKTNKNKGIASATNSAMKLATGDIFAFFDQDDVLHSNALEFVCKYYKSNPDCDLVYTNESKCNEHGKIIEEIKKPDFAIEFLYQNQFINHLLTVKKSLAEKVGKWSSKYKYCADYDYVLRAVNSAKAVGHVAKILYFWRIHSENTGNTLEKLSIATIEQKALIKSTIEKTGKNIDVFPLVSHIGRFSLQHNVEEEPKILIIIPTKDFTFTKDLLNSIEANTIYKNYDILVIHADQAENPLFQEYLETMKKNNGNFNWIPYREQFNYSKIHNFAISEFGKNYEYYCLVNDDVIVGKRWLTELVGVAETNNKIGIVGAKLFLAEKIIRHSIFPNDFMSDGAKIQHCGVKLFRDVGASHTHNRMPSNTAVTTFVKEMEAVTFALVLIRAKVFDEIKFDEILSCDFNDIDYCIEASKKGWKIFYTPWAQGFHIESATRYKYHLAGIHVNRDHFVTKHKALLANKPLFMELNAYNASGC